VPPPSRPPPPPSPPSPPAATPAPGPRDTEVVYDPKKKTFLINVQYVLRNRSCRNPCPARAEIRTRSGRRLYSAGALPGDGRVVLGARRGIKIPRGRKVFFWIPIKATQLRKVHFKTIRGYRYGETRLRVWLRTPRGEVVTVRDGRIRVSIARIKSGTLPNLRGHPLVPRREEGSGRLPAAGTPRAAGRASEGRSRRQPGPSADARRRQSTSGR
jgi:hypothetical protein